MIGAVGLIARGDRAVPVTVQTLTAVFTPTTPTKFTPSTSNKVTFTF
jgi:hypothetical protein